MDERSLDLEARLSGFAGLVTCGDAPRPLYAPGRPWWSGTMAGRAHHLPTTRTQADGGGRLAAPLPAGAAGAWCRVSLSLPVVGPWWARLALTDLARGQVVREVFLGPLQRDGGRWRRVTLVHVPAGAQHVSIDLFAASCAGAELSLQVLARGEAALRLALRGARLLPAAIRGSPFGVLGRVRALIGQAPARTGQAPSYADWIALFERPPSQAALQAGRAWGVQVAIIAGTPEAVAASLASAAQQLPRGVPACVIAAQDDWAALSATWIILLQAGEILAPSACAAFAAAAAFAPWAEALTADCDTHSAEGVRHDPLFKPGADSLLPGSAFLAQGAMAALRIHFTASLPLQAQAARALLAQNTAGRIAHVPGILSHVPQAASPPARPSPKRRTVQPCVNIVMPTTARGRHVMQCLRAVALGTDYDDFSISLVLASPRLAHARVLGAARRLKRVRVVPLDVTPFNYARVNNQAANGCTGELVLLMNDDVAPLERRWLAAMVAHMQDPRVGIVGARLLYGNGMVQHEGVIMGLANLCEHAGRLRKPGDPGPHGIGVLDREVSAVTGACLLIRSCLYRELGGMDETFAIALNDVDLCLRARQAGWRVVYCAEAVLYHYESLSLGRHYGGARAGLESVEVQLLRGRFADTIEADPFYNPLASLQPGFEWQPAFPPRAHPPALGVANL